MLKRGLLKFSNKKGSLITRQMLIHLGMISLLVFVYFLLKGYVDSVRNDAQFEMTFLTRDLALLMNTIYSAPGDVDYEYSYDKMNFYNFNFEIGDASDLDNKPTVKVAGYEQKKLYPYAKNLEDRGKYSIASPKSLKFTKRENMVSIAKNE